MLPPKIDVRQDLATDDIELLTAATVQLIRRICELESRVAELERAKQ